MDSQSSRFLNARSNVKQKASQHTSCRIEQDVCCDLSRRELNPATGSDEAASPIYHQRVNGRPTVDCIRAGLLRM